MNIRAFTVATFLVLTSSVAYSMDTCDALFVTRVAPSTVPMIKREAGVVQIEWAGIQERLAKLPHLKGVLQELKASIYVNGIEMKTDIGWATNRVSLAEKPNRQTDYYIIHKRNGKIVDISDFQLKESADGQNVLPTSFAGRYEGERFRIEYSESMKREGLSAELTESAVRLGYKKVVWVLSPDVSAATKKFVEAAVTGVDVRADFGKNGKPERILMVDRSTGRSIEVPPREVYVKVDAAFSGNAFYWDDMLVALATVPYHPALAESTLRFWLMVQQRNGGVIPREVRKENLLSLWFPEAIRDGRKPKTNLTFTNPYLMNWVADALYRFDPSQRNLALLKDVSKSIEDYTGWMEKNRAVRDESGQIIGFNGSALGSGADNSRGEVGNRGEAKAYRTAFVDFISQHVSMLRDQARWNLTFAEKSKNAAERDRYLAIAEAAKAKADGYTETLNERYWNEERGFYFDLKPVGKGHVQNLDYQPITGFWALYAGAASGARLDRLVETQFLPETFGGDFPLPANARGKIDPKAKVLYKPRPNYRDEDGYWDKWAHWPSMAMVVIDGLRRSGRPDVAHELAKNYLIKMAESSPKTVEENYGEVEVVNPDGSKSYRARPGQHASHPHRPDFAGWGKGPPIYLALLDVIGLNPRADGVLDWTLRSDLKVGEELAVPNLQFKGGTLERLKLRRLSDSQYELEVQSNVAFSFSLSSLVDGEGRARSTVQRMAPKITVAPGSVSSRFVLTL